MSEMLTKTIKDGQIRICIWVRQATACMTSSWRDHRFVSGCCWMTLSLLHAYGFSRHDSTDAHYIATSYGQRWGQDILPAATTGWGERLDGSGCCDNDAHACAAGLDGHCAYVGVRQSNQQQDHSKPIDGIQRVDWWIQWPGDLEALHARAIATLGLARYQNLTCWGARRRL